MSRRRLLTVREVSQTLRVPESKVLELVDEEKVPAYRIADEFLRFDADKIRDLKPGIQEKLGIKDIPETFKDRVLDFVHYYDFYFVSVGVIVFLVFYIFKSI